jgi:hypothetical protein
MIVTDVWMSVSSMGRADDQRLTVEHYDSIGKIVVGAGSGSLFMTVAKAAGLSLDLATAIEKAAGHPVPGVGAAGSSVWMSVSSTGGPDDDQRLTADYRDCIGKIVIRVGSGLLLMTVDKAAGLLPDLVAVIEKAAGHPVLVVDAAGDRGRARLEAA